MKAIQINKFRSTPFLNLKSKLPDINLLNTNEMIVKVKYSPINPCDLGWINGLYGNNLMKENATFPLTVGFEGSGIVTKSYNNKSTFKEGDLVSFYTNNGSWAEYTIVNENNCINLSNLNNKNNEDFMIKNSMLFINPLTAYAFLSIVKEFKKNSNLNEISVVNTACKSFTGKYFTRLCSENNINLINIYRKTENSIDDYIHQYKENKNIHFLDSSKEDFIAELNKMCNQLNCYIAFDCIGGELSGKIFHCLKESQSFSNPTTMYNYGNLLMRNLSGITTDDLIFNRKVLKGFWLFDYLNNNNSNTLNNYKNSIEFEKELINNKNSDFNVSYEVNKCDEFLEAIKNYKENMSKYKKVLSF